MWSANRDYVQSSGWYRPAAAGGGGGVAFKWRNAQDDTFVAGATSVNVGATAPAFSNGSFTAGDILIAQIMVESDVTDTVVPPAGWTSLATQRVDASNNRHSWFWRLCDGSESGSFAFTWTNSNFFSWVLASYSGAAASPLDGTPISAVYAGPSGSVTTSSLTTSNAGSMLVLFMGGAPSATIIVPANMTSRFNANQISDSLTAAFSDRLPGSSGAFTESFTSNGDGAYMILALHP